jgi:hypothetical protein
MAVARDSTTLRDTSIDRDTASPVYALSFENGAWDMLTRLSSSTSNLDWGAENHSRLAPWFAVFRDDHVRDFAQSIPRTEQIVAVHLFDNAMTRAAN